MISRGQTSARSGITLTEILIAILIMGVGLISLATLFPLGLLRLRLAGQLSRAALTYESAADDIDSRELFYKPTFTNTWYWYTDSNGNVVPRDPFSQDAAVGLPNGNPVGMISSTPFSYNSVGLTTGLPICYDPLWRSITGVAPNTALRNPTLDYAGTYSTSVNEARLGDGVLGGSSPFIRKDPDGGVASAYGLQRLTNFVPWSSALLTPQYAFTCTNHSLGTSSQPPDVTGNIFASKDDIVFNTDVAGSTGSSPLLPDLTSGSAQADYRFTWFYTGRQADAGGNGTQFVGDVVVCDSRPFGFDPVPGASVMAPAGETVVEAIYGVGSGGSIVPVTTGASVGFAVNDRSILLRWPDSMPDPQVRVGSWIADVTYERNVSTYVSRVSTTATTFARCNWYQVAKRVDPQADPTLSGFRSMVVTTTAPVRAKTLLDTSGNPTHVNVALIMPSVVNVFPRAFEVH